MKSLSCLDGRRFQLQTDSHNLETISTLSPGGNRRAELFASLFEDHFPAKNREFGKFLFVETCVISQKKLQHQVKKPRKLKPLIFEIPDKNQKLRKRA